MKRVLATLPVVSDGGVVAARQAARRIAELLGLDRQVQVRFATAVSEIARNAHLYARGGEAAFAVDVDAEAPWLAALVSDCGPGIADLDDVFAGRRAYAPGHGNGIAHARRLADEFDVETAATGTTVRVLQRLPRRLAARLSPAALDDVAASLDQRRADPMAALREQDRELVDSLTALQERQNEAQRLNRELEETNRGVVALYSELEQKAEALRSASDMKSRFLSQISHEFRTPLNSILALARLLADGVDGELNGEQQRQVDYVRRSAQGLLELVNDLLDLAKVEAGKLELRPTAFDIAGVFAGLRGSLKPLLVNAAVELVFVEPDGLPELVADEPKLAQILRNLVANALKFTEAGHVRVSVRHDTGDERIVFTVEDTGIGIAAEMHEPIFEEFAQVHGPLQRGGTGLGLPLSRQLARLMGGDVTVQSTPGAGSVFRVSLPATFVDGDDARPAAAAALARVLVVDDEEAFRYVIRHIAQDAGFEALEAADAEAGLALVLQRRPAIVVLDLHMPGSDGHALMERLQALREPPPVIVCTSQLLTPADKRALAAAYAIVPKHEVSRDGLTALLQGIVGRFDDTAP